MNLWRHYPKRFLWVLYFVGLGLSLLSGFLFPALSLLHSHFPFQKVPQFFALYGFFGSILLILIARGMGSYLSKEEDYDEKEGGRRV